MVWGIKVNGLNGNLCISSEDKSMDYIGAPQLESSLYLADEMGIFYQELYNGTNREIDSGTNGLYRIACYSDFYGSSNCGNGNDTIWNYELVDEIGIFKFSIYSQIKPLVFIHSNSGYHATVVGVSDSGGIHPVSGYPKWEIKVAAVYPEGQRTGIWSNISLYCFDLLTDTGETYGVKIFKDDGSLAFMNSDAPLVIKEILEITSLTTGLVMSSNTLVKSLSDLGQLSKPAFLGLDFARYTAVDSSDTFNNIGRRVLHVGMNGAYYTCEDYRKYYPKFTRAGIWGGLRYNAVSQDIDLAGFTIKVTDMDAVPNSKPATGVIEVQHALPAYIPIIDGADYD